MSDYCNWCGEDLDEATYNSKRNTWDCKCGCHNINCNGQESKGD
jgi:hypothetical protein